MNNGQINIPIIPVDQIFYSTSTRELIQWKDTRDLEIDYQAIAIFCALGFMLDDDTYYKDIKTCKPSTKYDINNNLRFTFLLFQGVGNKPDDLETLDIDESLIYPFNAMDDFSHIRVQIQYFF